MEYNDDRSIYGIRGKISGYCGRNLYNSGTKYKLSILTFNNITLDKKYTFEVLFFL